MKNATQQPLKQKWTGPIDKSGKFTFGLNGLFKGYVLFSGANNHIEENKEQINIYTR